MPLQQSLATAAAMQEAKAAESLKGAVVGLHVQLNSMASQYLALDRMQADEGDRNKLADSRAAAVATLAGSITGAGAESAATVKAFLDELSAAIG